MARLRWVVLLVLWAPLAFVAPRASPKANARLPQRATVDDRLLGRTNLMREASKNKTGLTMMILTSVATCILTALERQCVGELTQFCFLAQERAQFWPRMRKVLWVLLMSPVVTGALSLASRWTSNSIKLSIQTASAERVLSSDSGLLEGSATSLFTNELEQLTGILQQLLRGAVGSLVFSRFIWKLLQRGDARFRQVFAILMLIVVVGVVVSMNLQKMMIGPAAIKATNASRQVAEGVVAELKVAEETRAYGAAVPRGEILAGVMQNGIEKEFELGKRQALWQAVEGWRSNGNLIAIYFLIGRAIMVGEMPFAAYHATFGLSINLAFSLRDLLQSAAQITRCGQTIRTINELSSPTKGVRTCAKHRRAGTLKVTDLSVKKEGSWLLQGVSFEVPRGQLVAVVGPSGSGKSTLLRALDGRVRGGEKHSGEIVGGGAVAFLPQDVPLLPDTLQQNVAMHRDLSEEAIRKCLREANASDLVQHLGSFVSGGHANWTPSGGEAQRIGLARAICGRPELLLLDEPTSALDVKAENAVFEMLKGLTKQNTTVLMVTHRVRLAERSDEVMVMKGGKMVQRGRHGALAKDPSGEYYKLRQAARF